MYLGYRKMNGTRYLALLRSVRNPHSGSKETRVVQRFWKEDDVPPSVRALMQDSARKASMAQRLASASPESMEAMLLQAASQSEPAPAPLLPAGDSPAFNRIPVLHYGHLALKGLWDKELKLRPRIDYLQKRNTEITAWKLSDLLFYLAARKVIEPASYFDASSNRHQYLYCPWAGVTQDGFYRALDFLYVHGQALIAHAVRTRMERRGEKIRVAFFDCTNTWFETPYDDLTWQIIRFRRKVSARLEKKGTAPEAIEQYLESDGFAKKLREELSLTEDDIIRLRGPSKDGRFAQPLVLVALAIDQSGFPVDCRVFSGNLSEVKTIEPMIRSLQEKYGVKDAYFTADRGLNSTESLSTIASLGPGYVVAQKVTRQKKEVRGQMLDLQGYRRFVSDGDSLSPEEGDVTEECCRFKVCDFEKTAMVERGDGSLTGSGNPRKKKLSVKCRIIFTYSPERRRRDMAELNNDIARASKAVAQGELMGNRYSSGWRGLVKTAKEAAGNKEDKEQYRARGLKDDVIEERKAVAGYHAVVFAHPKDADPENVMSDEQILAAYHRLVNIEECFRIMKSSFSLRPMYVRLKSRITAHCYLCVLALMMLRELQERVAAAGVNMPAARLCSALSEARLGFYGDEYENLSFLNLGTLRDAYAPEFTGKTRKEEETNAVLDSVEVTDSYLAYRKEHREDTDIILMAAGLKPLMMISSLADLKRSLSLQPVPNSRMVADVSLEYAREAMNSMRQQRQIS